MSRSGYVDDCEDNWRHIMWRGAVASALNGKRGQETLKEIAGAFDRMEQKELAKESLIDTQGAYCTLGVLGAARGMDMSAIDPEDIYTVAREFGISVAMAREIVYMNDEGNYIRETPQERWKRMRGWIESHIKEPKQ